MASLRGILRPESASRKLPPIKGALPKVDKTMRMETEETHLGSDLELLSRPGTSMSFNDDASIFLGDAVETISKQDRFEFPLAPVFPDTESPPERFSLKHTHVDSILCGLAELESEEHHQIHARPSNSFLIDAVAEFEGARPLPVETCERFGKILPRASNPEEAPTATAAAAVPLVPTAPGTPPPDYRWSALRKSRHQFASTRSEVSVDSVDPAALLSEL